FTFDRERAIAICEGILKRNYKIQWHCFARADSINKITLKLMKKAGCFSVLYGIESGDEEVMENIKKGFTLKQAREALSLSNQLGLKTLCVFMFGNKGDNPETLRKTLNFARELKPTIASFHIMVPYPGTTAYKDACAGNHPCDWNDFIARKGRHVLPDAKTLSIRELKKFQIYAFRSFYGRPLQIMKILRHVSNLKELSGYAIGMFKLVLRLLNTPIRRNPLN
ncbi:B12-binding domain-containing radical SAM protein, partial [Candidatus Omnitrophota bacterium]